MHEFPWQYIFTMNWTLHLYKTTFIVIFNDICLELYFVLYQYHNFCFSVCLTVCYPFSHIILLLIFVHHLVLGMIMVNNVWSNFSFWHNMKPFTKNGSFSSFVLVITEVFDLILFMLLLIYFNASLPSPLFSLACHMKCFLRPLGLEDRLVEKGIL